jgi:hypothetical protein
MSHSTGSQGFDIFRQVLTIFDVSAYHLRNMIDLMVVAGLLRAGLSAAVVNAAMLLLFQHHVTPQSALQ